MKKIRMVLMSGWVGATLLLAGCGSTAHVERDKSVNFSQFKTFAWTSPSDSTPKSYRKGSLAEQAIHETVNSELIKEGWKEVTNNPDVLLSYDVLVQHGSKRLSDPVYSQPFFRTFYNPFRGRYFTIYYPSQFWGYNSYNVPVKEGTITVTMTDAKTDKMVWQGWSTREVDSRYLTAKDVQSSVKSIFRKFDVAKN